VWAIGFQGEQTGSGNSEQNVSISGVLLITLGVKHLQIKVFEIAVYQTFRVWKEAQWMHVLKGNESLRMTKWKTWLQEVS